MQTSGTVLSCRGMTTKSKLHGSDYMALVLPTCDKSLALHIAEVTETIRLDFS